MRKWVLTAYWLLLWQHSSEEWKSSTERKKSGPSTLSESDIFSRPTQLLKVQRSDRFFFPSSILPPTSYSGTCWCQQNRETCPTRIWWKLCRLITASRLPKLLEAQILQQVHEVRRDCGNFCVRATFNSRVLQFWCHTWCHVMRQIGLQHQQQSDPEKALVRKRP